ncbi:E3 ubiquitin-protein ligase RING1-like [Rhodamnia argentea]|uniref:E3 ubiquitin-protein ligase RING1-like n=1 Tax=Rhodamnia argentea TaxID=178133 RepID=A0A8B8NBY1_9MYRT|nr:E3 ubiquitin-protein ligase RING1-like [Rhodamnia argentea]
MSGRASNFPPAPDQEWSPWDYFFDDALPSPAVLPRAVSYRTTPPGLTRTPSFDPERVMPRPNPSSLAGFTTPSLPLMLLENAYARPRSIVEPPPRSIGQPNAQVLSEQDSMLTGDEQKKVLSKLKKEIYNPLPKSYIRRVSLYYRENARNGLGDQNRYPDDDDGKRCAICLDDFEPKQEVMVTPCNHMFHEDCIVPWLQGHRQCPVCRFSLLEQKRQTQPPIAPVAIQSWETVFYVPETLFR